jgi:hypothetical protein
MAYECVCKLVVIFCSGVINIKIEILPFKMVKCIIGQPVSFFNLPDKIYDQKYT